jgi:hypothetical protein
VSPYTPLPATSPGETDENDRRAAAFFNVDVDIDVDGTVRLVLLLIIAETVALLATVKHDDAIFVLCKYYFFKVLCV